MTKKKLKTSDFYSQFHNHEHHNDPGEYTKPEWHKLNPNGEKRHAGLDLKALRNAKKKRRVVVAKGKDAIALELVRKKKKAK